MRASAACVALLGCACALGCSKTKLSTAPPRASVTPASLDFGTTAVLFPVRRSVVIGDVSVTALHVSGIALAGAQAAAFAVDPAVIEISPGATHELVVLFTPPAEGVFAGELDFATDDPDHPAFAIPLAGVASGSAALSVRPASLDFGRVGEGQTAVREVTLASVGKVDLYLASLGFAPGTPADFAVVSGAAPATLAAGASAQVGVRYSPAVGAQLAPGALRIGSSDPLQPQLDVPLSATINRAPVPRLTGQVNGGQPTAGELDTAVGATVQLDGSGSTDPDGDLPLALRWTLAARPAGSNAQLSAASGATNSLVLDQPGAYSVLLAATDATGLPSILPARLDLRALPPNALIVQLVWDAIPPDLDLKLQQLSPAGVAESECSWTNPDPAWFPGGADANPHHQGDKLTGYGPEEIDWKQPADGDYRIVVNYKSDHGAAAPGTNAEVRIYAFGALIADLRHPMQHQGDEWDAAVIHWPAARVEVLP